MADINCYLNVITVLVGIISIIIAASIGFLVYFNIQQVKKMAENTAKETADRVATNTATRLIKEDKKELTKEAIREIITEDIKEKLKVNPLVEKLIIDLYNNRLHFSKDIRRGIFKPIFNNLDDIINQIET